MRWARTAVIQRPAWIGTGALLVAMAGLALSLRLYNLGGRSLWLDEIATANASLLPTPGEVIAWSQTDINGMPAFYLLTWLLSRWGESEALLRLPSVLAGAILVLVVYRLGSKLFGRRVGLIAGLLLCVLPFAVWYSQEARNYALLMLTTALQMLFAWQAVKRGRVLDWIGLAAVTILSLYTHYLALAATAAVALYVVIFLGPGVLARASSAVKAATAAGLGIMIAAAALVPWHQAATGLLGRAAAEMARLGPAAIVLALTAGAVPSLIVAGFLAWRRSRRTTVATAAALVLLLVVLAGVFRPGPLSPPGVHLQLRFAAALAAVAAATMVAAGFLVIDLWRPPPEALRRLGPAVGCGIVVALAYSPWLPSLLVFLSRPDQSIGRYDPSHRPTLPEVLNLLAGLSFSGLSLAALGLGLVTLGAWLFRGRARESALLLCWIGVPVFVLWLVLRGGIVTLATSNPLANTSEVRYFALLVPALVLTTAAGLEAAIRGVDWAARRSLGGRYSPALGSVIALLLTVLLIAQPAAATVASYRMPKQDWRGVASYIAASSPAGSTVLAVGAYEPWAVISLNYYFRQLKAPVAVYDGTEVGSDVTSRLLTSRGIVWGVTVPQSPAQRSLASGSTVEVTRFVDVTGFISVVRPFDDRLSAIEQARTLIGWEYPIEPDLRASMLVLDLLSHHADLGPDLVTAPSSSGHGPPGWDLAPGTSSDGTTLVLTPGPARPEVDARYTANLEPGVPYLFSFESRDPALSGSELAYAVAVDGAGQPISAFPSGAGYACPHSDAWTPGYFGFEVPPGTSSVILFLRARGTGVAEFRSVQLNQLISSPPGN